MSLNINQYYTSGRTFNAKGNKNMLNAIERNAFNPTRKLKGKKQSFVNPELEEMKCGGKVHKMEDGGSIPKMRNGDDTVSLGPAYDSRYGFMGKLAYDKTFRGQRTPSTIHNLSGDVYGGDFGIGVSAGHRFGSEDKNIPAFKYTDIRLGYDSVRGAYGDWKGAGDIHILDDKYKGKFDVTPYGGVFAQSKTSEQSMNQNDLTSKIGLLYGLNAKYQKDLGGGNFEAFAGIGGSPSLGKVLSKEKAESGRVEFAPQFNFGAKYTLPLKRDKVKGIIAKQKAKEVKILADEKRETEAMKRRAEYTKPVTGESEFVKEVNGDPLHYQFGGEVMELSDSEIAKLRKGGHIVIEQ